MLQSSRTKLVQSISPLFTAGQSLPERDAQLRHNTTARPERRFVYSSRLEMLGLCGDGYLCPCPGSSI